MSKDTTADVIVVHENENYPDEKTLQGDYFGGHADYPPYRRASLVHSMLKLDEQQVAVMARHTRWVYVTEDLYKPNTPGADNPWDSLSGHTEKLLELHEIKVDHETVRRLLIKEGRWQVTSKRKKRHQAWLEAVTRRGRNITGCARSFLDGDAGHIVYNPHLKLSGATYFS